MTQQLNSNNPYGNNESPVTSAGANNPYAQQSPVVPEPSNTFESTVEQSAAYQAALARQKALEAEQKAAAEAQAKAEALASQKAEEEAQAKAAVIAAAQDGDAWTCGCGHANTGNFCSECGAQKGGAADAVPATPVVSATPAQQTPAQNAQQPYNPYANNNNPYAQQQDGQNAWAPQQPNQPFEVPEEQPQRDFSTGSFNFFKKSDPDDQSPGLKWGGRIGWFAIGLVGGIFGILIAWMSTSSLGPKYRRQAMMAAWLGLVAQAALYMITTFTGAQIPFLSQSSSAAVLGDSGASSAAGNAAAGGNTKAFG